MGFRIHFESGAFLDSEFEVEFAFKVACRLTLAPISSAKRQRVHAFDLISEVVWDLEFALRVGLSLTLNLKLNLPLKLLVA